MAMCRLLYMAMTACANHVCSHHLAMTSFIPREAQRKDCTWLPSETRKARKAERREWAWLLPRNKIYSTHHLGSLIWGTFLHLPTRYHKEWYVQQYTMICIWSLIHCTVLPTPSGVPLLHGGPPPWPGLPQHPGGWEEAAQDIRLWSLPRHTWVRVLPPGQDATEVDGTRDCDWQCLHRQVRCVRAHLHGHLGTVPKCTLRIDRTSVQHYLSLLALYIYRWSFGVCLWEMCTLGEYLYTQCTSYWCLGYCHCIISAQSLCIMQTMHEYTHMHLTTPTRTSQGSCPIEIFQCLVL